MAEHALTLALAGLRHLPTRVAARSWGAPAGTSLYDQRVTILGGGGIASVLLEQLAPFRVESTVVRRRPTRSPVRPGPCRCRPSTRSCPGAAGGLSGVWPSPRRPTGIIGAAELAASWTRRAWLVNVARGRHVDTEALVTALRPQAIAGAALDVTDPEPLPDGHPLWDLPNCIITPHTADTIEMVMPAARRTDPDQRRAGSPPASTLVGLVDADAGY